MTLTKDQLLKIYPTAINTKLGIDNLVAAINSSIGKLGVGKYRAPMFLAQTGEESAQYNRLVENLNYSAEALLKIFPTHFSGPDDAANYARQPEKIANRIYSNRMGNGDEASGDGWKFRGRGFIQITGHDNYLACGNFLGVDLIKNPEYLLTAAGASDSAVFYWITKGINTYADLENVTVCTKLINGGTLGLDLRTANYNLAKQVLGV